MFEDLKKHITKQNLNLIKKKNRYLEDQLSNGNDVKSKESYFHRQDKQKQSQDSLSDYQIMDKQQAFNKIMNKDQIYNKSINGQSFENKKIMNLISPQPKHYYEIQNSLKGYFTPHIKAKQLQRQLQLSIQKNKLLEQYHLRQIQHLRQTYQRKILQVKIQSDKFKIISQNNQFLQNRIKLIYKQNTNLKQTLSQYEQKYWNYQNLLKQKKQKQQKLNYLIHQNQSLRTLNQSLKQQQQQLLKISKQKNIKFSQNENNHKLCQQKIDQLTRKLKKSQVQKQKQQKMSYEQKKNYDQKIFYLQKSNQLLDSQLKNMKRQIQKLKYEKQQIQKSLIDTLNSYSKHLNTTSINYQQNYLANNNLTNKLNIQNSNKMDQTTINLQNQNINELLSPVKYKNQCENINSLQKQIGKRTRIMSHGGYKGLIMKQKQNYTISNKKKSVFDPQNQNYKIYYENNIINKLENKLKQANQKIVELLKQKIILKYKKYEKIN